MAEVACGISQTQEDARTPRAALDPLPRSVIRGTSYELLDGEWRFEVDAEDSGLRDRWYFGHQFTGTAHWPGSIESHLAAARQLQQGVRSWQDAIVVWYERDFTVPAAWLESPDHEVHLTFGACGYETRVWLNGHALFTVDGEEVHTGEYTSFGYELRGERLLPVNRLTVRIANSMDAEIPRGKQESRVYQRGGIWYQTISGAVRSIWLEPVERNRLRGRLNVLSQANGQVVEFDLTIRIHDPGIYQLRVLVTPPGAGQPAATSTVSLPLDRGDSRQRIAVRIEDAQSWSPARPSLYRVVAQLSGSRENISQIEARFGIRHVETRDHLVYLNNEPLYLDGMLYQPGASTLDQIQRHLRAMKELGCNLVRVHIAGIDPRVCDLADEMGMLLWLEVPSPHSSTKVSRENHWAEIRRMLVLLSYHPSVIIWSMYNEDWGAQDIATSQETRAYIAQVHDYLQLQYPQFLIVDNDGWHHVSIEGRLQSSLLTAHLYTPDLASWQAVLDRLTVGNLTGVAAYPLVTGDPFVYVGQLPLVVSEWGGFGFADYGGPHDAGAKAEWIRAFKAELRRRPIAGDVYTQAISIEDEVNGIIDADTGAPQLPAGIFKSRPPMD